MEENTEKFAEFWQYIENKRPSIEEALREYRPLAPAEIETRFNEAVDYALFSGGKRLRPVLTLLGAELFGGRAETLLPAAAAVEFIHTSSLIFDDLPCMDNARERRGKTSVHEKFGEGLAVLVAIGFLNASYALVFVNHAGLPERAMLAHAELVECIGASGMIGGQSVDLALAKGAGDAGSEEFEAVRNLKTSALMRLCLRVGAILAGASHLDLVRLSRFAELLGDAYQLGDDLLDLEEDDAIFADEQKTFALAQGRERARMQLRKFIDEAKLILIDNFPPSEARSCLIQLTDYLAERRA
ncbi:MAG: polyprenyl synthetase family protein [Acidobacteria bacterium]|nr:polyprenyl synthetase family protein [Acidobacteriota bacterium]